MKDEWMAEQITSNGCQLPLSIMIPSKKNPNKQGSKEQIAGFEIIEREVKRKTETKIVGKKEALA